MPLVGCNRAFKCCKRVDLPDPVCPIIAINFPEGIVRLIFLIASLSKGVFA
jgi:hypothetical protein